jgi:hypothetical protein
VLILHFPAWGREKKEKKMHQFTFLYKQCSKLASNARRIQLKIFWLPLIQYVLGFPHCWVVTSYIHNSVPHFPCTWSQHTSGWDSQTFFQVLLWQLFLKIARDNSVSILSVLQTSPAAGFKVRSSVVRLASRLTRTDPCSPGYSSAPWTVTVPPYAASHQLLTKAAHGHCLM